MRGGQHARTALLAGAVALAAGCAGGSGQTPPRVRALDAVTGKTWQWEALVSPVDTLAVPAPDRYTIELAPNGRVLVRADCNRGSGTYHAENGRLGFEPFAMTRMTCPPGSLDVRFVTELQRATSFFVAGEALHLELPMDSGTLRFAPGR